MAGIASFECFLNELKDLYTTKKFSDVQLNIVEDDGESEGKVIDVHAFVLVMNSEYFRGLLKEHEKGQIKFTLKLKAGQADHMLLLLSGFYDKNVFSSMGIVQLLAVLELAVGYTNDEFIRCIAKVIDGMQVVSEMAHPTLDKIYTWEHDGGLNTDLLKNVKSKCTQFFVAELNPIEEKHDEGKFLELKYNVLLYLLESDHVWSASENSLLHFVILWLEYDLTRQSGQIIGNLLSSLRVKYLNIDYLFYTIRKDNSVLSKWDGFHDWICQAVALPGMSSSVRTVMHPTFDVQVYRNCKHGIHAWYQNCLNPPQYVPAIKWLVHMTPEIPGVKYGPTKCSFVHDGYNFSVNSINITPVEGDASKYNMSMSIKCSGVAVGTSFVVGIVPANTTYDTSEIYFSSYFAQNFLKWSDPHNFNKDAIDIEYWTVDKDFIDVANEHGLFACLRPVTTAEYDKLQSFKFKCTVLGVVYSGDHDSGNHLPLFAGSKCSFTSHTNYGDTDCPAYSCSADSKIILSKDTSSNIQSLLT